MYKKRHYLPVLTATKNAKGVLDIDTVKGCTFGMNKYPDGGCYGECYANKTATHYGIDFSNSVSRKINYNTFPQIFKLVDKHYLSWYRIGTFGDPCHDWDNTIDICERLRGTKKIPIIVTKHWIRMTDNHLSRFKSLNAVINTSTSGLDDDDEMDYRVGEINRIKAIGIRSVCRVVTCCFGVSKWAIRCKKNKIFYYLLRQLLIIHYGLQGQIFMLKTVILY